MSGKQKSGLREFRTVIPYLKKYRVSYILGFVCLVVVDGAQAVIPQFIRMAVDLITAGDFAWMAVFRLCLAMLGVMALIALGRFLWRYFIHGSSRRIETELRDNLFGHLLTLSWDFYQKHKIGDLMARSINDINAIRNALGWGLVTLVDGTVMASAILVIIFVQDPRTAVFCIIPLPFITIIMLLFGKAMGRLFHRAQETYSTMSDTVQETFAGIRVIKSFVKEWWFIKKFAEANDDYRKANMGLVKLYGVFFPFVSFLAGLTTIILLLVGGRRVVTGDLSPGELVALFSYLQMLIWPLMGAGFMVNMIQRGAASMGRINELLNSEPSIQSPQFPESPESQSPQLIQSRRNNPVIELRNLSFSYGQQKAETETQNPEDNPVPVLKDISLSIPRGTVLGILGRTGSGKSTLLKTLTRTVDPPDGTVFVEGIDVKKRDLQDLRRLFGVSPQDSYLFSDSIKNNIAYGNKGEEEPDEAALNLAAGLSALDGDLAAFGGGWDTLIGERGLTLSGGQKQRVAIARSLLAAPEILVLDDAFSAVDAETEKRILTGVLEERRKGKGKTTIIVSHRVSTLSSAGMVAVLEDGRLSELGTPAELLKAGRFFARMAELQRLGEGAGSAAAGGSLG
ncbi:multidrug ABC transporter ATP-binding protein [Spirochaetia bacterium]|nr:multidrug ABC transporter ATP-binding protein [Spirochaetia bacterium]